MAERVISGTVRTGFVTAGGYAYKLRRVLFAQLKSLVQTGQLDSEEVARAAGVINALLYEVIVERVKLRKNDVVRVTVNYRLRDRTLEWDMDSLQLELYRRVDAEEVKSALAEARRSVAESASQRT
ncbi:MAG: DUF2258 domain-containing protein [Nitrososphaerota archaeon]|nr:DUF2258 domain-containing protein [Nitrososphaerota archaeon]